MSDDQPPPAARTCGICWGEFIPRRANNIYCSIRCKNAAFDRKRRPRNGDATDGAERGPAGRLAPRPQPVAVRDCPHCGGPVTIVALLTTPEAARPTPPATASNTVIPLHRL